MNAQIIPLPHGRRMPRKPRNRDVRSREHLTEKVLQEAIGADAGGQSFEAKAFLADAFAFFDGTCPRCVIDNTSVLVVSGAGADATFAPEMVAFARAYGSAFWAHAVGHADRKGRVEQPFAYIEGNFLAGRSFKDWDYLNAQVLAWCTDTANTKTKRALGMSPEAAYVLEKPHLINLPEHRPPVYQVFERIVDVTGFVSLDTLCRVQEYAELLATGAWGNRSPSSRRLTYSGIVSKGGDQLVRCAESTSCERWPKRFLNRVDLLVRIGSHVYLGRLQACMSQPKRHLSNVASRLQNQRNGPGKLDTAISGVCLGFHAANAGVACPKYTASGVRRSSAL